MRPRMPQQQASTPRGQEVTPAMPYQQQVFPPKCPAPKPSTTPSASQGHRDPAGERRKVPEVGPHPKGLRTDNDGADPPPEDPRSADGVPPVTV